MSDNNTPASPAPAEILAIIANLRRRQRLVNLARWAAYGLLVGAAIGCALALVLWAALHVPTSQLAFAAAACILGATLILALVGLVLPIDNLRLARAMDRAAASEDRFASALQLAAHAPVRHQSRAGLVVQDAISRIRGTKSTQALPVHLPRAARYIPVPLIAIVALLLLLPQAGIQAVAAPQSEITAEEWASLHDQFHKDLAQMPKPQTEEEKEIQKQLEQLAAMLKEKPEKKDVLREIARLSDRIEQQKRASGSARAQSMRSAAKALAASQALKPFADQLKDGSYDQAAGALSKLSEQLKSGEVSPDAKEFEALASDLQRLSEQMDTEQDLKSECQKCSGAASSMNRQALAEAMKKFAEEMKKNAEKLRKCDGMCRSSSALDELKRRMSQCQGCKEGEGEGFCQNPSAKKGGKKAGWGSAANWEGGAIAKAAEERDPNMVNPLERPGASTTFQIVSPDEKAVSAKKYEELYAEFVAKNEADLDLESVPVAYREFLRKYFNSIRPKEAAPAASPEKPD